VTLLLKTAVEVAGAQLSTEISQQKNCSIMQVLDEIKDPLKLVSECGYMDE